MVVMMVKKVGPQIKSLDDCLKLEGWQGPPYINEAKQYEILFNKVSLSLSVCLGSIKIFLS